VGTVGAGGKDARWRDSGNESSRIRIGGGLCRETERAARRGASEIWKKQAGTTITADNTPKAGEYVVVTFLKAEPSKTGEYLDVWKKYSLPIQEERAKAGHLKSALSRNSWKGWIDGHSEKCVVVG
jgi:hypothetical protein